jgi:hypothetical protein
MAQSSKARLQPILDQADSVATLPRQPARFTRYIPIIAVCAAEPAERHVDTLRYDCLGRAIRHSGHDERRAEEEG